MSAQTQEPPRPTTWLGRQWDNWKGYRRAIMELSRCPSTEREHLARDIGVSEAEFCILARKPADASVLLSQRLNQLQLKPGDIRETEPLVLRDLQRVCSLCASKRRCKHDFAARPWSRVWREYCPNATTLDALLAQRSRQNHFQDDSGSAAYDQPGAVRYAPATIDPVGTTLLQMVRCARGADRLMIALAIAAATLVVLIATTLKLAGM